MSKWVHVVTAPDQIAGEIWVSILRDAGVRAMLHPSDAVSFLGISAVSCRVQVMDDDLERALEVLGDDAD